MKPYLSCILLCLLSSVSYAATYVWSGNAGNGVYGNSGNWTVNGGSTLYYPQSGSDQAIIGDNAGTITWSNAQQYFGATNTIDIGSGSTLLCTTRTSTGDLSVNKYTLHGNANLVFESANALGFKNNFTLDFGTFNANEHGSWTATNVTGFWANSRVVNFAGTLDMNSLSGSGTIELAAIKSSQLGGALTLNLSGIIIGTSPNVQANIVQETANGITRVLIHYQSVPEPSTATLGILALSGLLIRRKRAH